MVSEGVFLSLKTNTQTLSSELSLGWNSKMGSTFVFLTVSADVTVVTVQRSCSGVGLAAMILCIEGIDCDVNQVQQDLADLTVSVWILVKDDKQGLQPHLPDVRF